MYDTYLMHHGILGQKWGIRRYQNSDGSLTPEGRKRYLKNPDKNIKLIKNYVQKNLDLEEYYKNDTYQKRSEYVNKVLAKGAGVSVQDISENLKRGKTYEMVSQIFHDINAKTADERRTNFVSSIENKGYEGYLDDAFYKTKKFAGHDILFKADMDSYSDPRKGENVARECVQREQNYTKNANKIVNDFKTKMNDYLKKQEDEGIDSEMRKAMLKMLPDQIDLVKGQIEQEFGAIIDGQIIADINSDGTISNIRWDEEYW